MTDLIEKHQVTFEGIKHIDEEGNEFWLARELYPLLEYRRWDAFKNVIERATEACVKPEYISQSDRQDAACLRSLAFAEQS
jgi:hypothetical protein